MSNVKKPNQHLENLIKADGFEALPYWYREFIRQLMTICQRTEPFLIYSKSDYLRGYLHALFCAGVILNSMDLRALVDQAEAYAIKNNVKKAA